MKVSEFMESRYLSADDLSSGPVTGKIIEACIEFVKGDGGKQEKKLLIRVSGATKPIIVNKTSIKLIAHELGTETDDWLGCEVDLSGQVDIVFGQPKNVLRITPLKGGKPK